MKKKVVDKFKKKYINYMQGVGFEPTRYYVPTDLKSVALTPRPTLR